MIFYKVNSVEPVAKYLAQVIGEHLNKDEKVLWLVTGGSGVTVAAETAKKLSGKNLTNLSVTLTDERFVPKGHSDSNWQQLQEAGFELPGAQLLPVLSGEDISKNALSYHQTLEKALNENTYRIGIFGMGPDGHIAALFPNYPQLKENGMAANYLNDSPKPPPERLTITPTVIQQLDEAVIYAVGKEKITMLENLRKELPASTQPAQLLKNVPKLTIFNDQIGEEG